MIALYFPFTFVRPAADWLNATFETLCLLVPSAAQASDCLAPGIDAHPWRVRSLSRDDDAALQRIEAEMRHWAAVHAGSDLAALLASRSGGQAFFDLPEVSRLRQDIRAHARGRAEATGQDPLLAARVFLSFAHGLDRDRADLAGTWEALTAMEEEMMIELHGQSEDTGSSATSQTTVEDPGSFLTGHRLTAWARLALALNVTPDLVVTDSAAVFEAVRDVFPALRPLFNWPLAGLSADRRHWGDRFYAAIQAALAKEAPAGSPDAVAGSHLQVLTLDLCFEDFCRVLADGPATPTATASDTRLLIVGPAG